jgi:hypothetical protein
MMCKGMEIINIGNKHRNNHNIRTSLAYCPMEKNPDLSLRIERYGSNIACINDLYDNFATLQIHMISRYGYKNGYNRV